VPTYEYECQACGRRFEQRQAMSDAPIAACPACQGEVRRVVSGGAGFIIGKDAGHGRGSRRQDGCHFEQTGATCCGRQERCGHASCGEER